MAQARLTTPTPSVKLRFALRYAAADLPWPARHVEAILTALGQGLDIEFRFTREDIDPWFRLRGYRGAVHVLGSDFGHLATMAAVPAALVLGWERGGALGSWSAMGRTA